jgi:hypothetical protein
VRIWYVVTVYSCVETVSVSVCSREHRRMTLQFKVQSIRPCTSEGFKTINYSCKHSQLLKRTPDFTLSLKMNITVVLPDTST